MKRAMVFGAIMLWAAVILSRETKKVEDAVGVTYRPLKVEQDEIGIVDQIPFASDKRLPRWKAEHAAKLNGYGWVDRAKGVAHIPIERAMDAVAGGTLPAGAPR